MLRSMTAFAVVEESTPLGKLTCELRAVNHRFLELGVRMPEELRAFEPQVREAVSARVRRGKVDVSFRLALDEDGGATLQIDTLVLARLAALVEQVRDHVPGLRVEFTELLRFPGLLRQPRLPQTLIRDVLLGVLNQALDEFVAARAREGEKLARGMRARLAAIADQVQALRARMPEIRETLTLRLRDRLRDLADGGEPGRLEQELVLGLQKMDVEEELDRLDTHVAEAQRLLDQDDAVGRRLDFLLQEFNREANTLGSKSVDARSTQASVELKVIIEQLREQVQNIE